MKHRVAWLLGGLGVVVLGALLCLAGAVAARHGDALERASALAAAGDTEAALAALKAADDRYEETFWGVPQGPLLNVLSCLGFTQRADIRLQLAEMAYREGERLLGLYARAQLAAEVGEALNGTSATPSLEEVKQQFSAAVAQYKEAQALSRDPHRQFTARANGARAMTQLFMVRGFLGEEQSDQAGLKQGLMRAVKLLQEALDALYTDAVRVSSTEERSLVLLLEALTRFERRPDVEADERRRLAQFFRNSEFEPDVAPLGEILRSTDSQGLSRAESSMREFLLNQSPTTLRENERDPSGSRSGRGSADSGGEGGTH
ncbi:MAG: hypothetical protein OXP66_07920 [Candidatus Tectomicrobia bacterium]|nr:hypothetical protein [Candidatus Tectomicrobia bacterium]